MSRTLTPEDRFGLSERGVRASLQALSPRLVGGCALLVVGWLLRQSDLQSDAQRIRVVGWATSAVSFVLLLGSLAPYPTVRGYLVYLPLFVRNLATILTVTLLAGAAWAIVRRPEWHGFHVAHWTMGIFLALSLLPVFLINQYFVMAGRYARNTGATYGAKASAFLDISLNPLIHSARLTFHFVSTPFYALTALLDWRLTVILLWIEANRLASVLRVMRPPFALFLTGSFQTAEDDMLALRRAIGAHTMMHLVVGPAGRLPRHPRLSEDTFRLLPEAAAQTTFGDWTRAVEFQMQHCGVILVDGAAMSDNFRMELSLIEKNSLQWKTIVVDRKELQPEVAAFVARWQLLEKPAGVYDVGAAAGLLGRLASITFPIDETPVWRLVPA